MEGGNKKSGSSLASDLFGAIDSSSSTGGSNSNGIFGSIFAQPPNKGLGLGRGSVHSEAEKKNGSENPAWNSKNGVSENNAAGGEGKSQASKEGSSYYQDEKVQPFHYSSSIYYGGQDVYSRPPQNAQNPVFSTFNKDGGEDDPGSASRGNWWQGSLYY